MKNKNFRDEDHHILPRSRGGQNNGNIKRVRRDYHQAYHHLFENLTPSEIHQYLDEVWFKTKDFITPAKWLEQKKHPN